MFVLRFDGWFCALVRLVGIVVFAAGGLFALLVGVCAACRLVWWLFMVVWCGVAGCCFGLGGLSVGVVVWC